MGGSHSHSNQRFYTQGNIRIFNFSVGSKSGFYISFKSIQLVLLKMNKVNHWGEGDQVCQSFVSAILDLPSVCSPFQMRLGKVDFRRLVKGSCIDQSSQVGEGQAFKTMLNNSLHR